MEDKVKGEKAWGIILKNAVQVPGVRVDRAEFLTKELGKYVSDQHVEKAVNSRPGLACIEKKTLDKIADGCIRLHLTRVTGLSFAAGLPGGWWLAGTLPADLAQYFGNLIQLTQKLAYLYGWPELDDPKQMDDDTLGILTTLVGVAVGAEGAANAVRGVSVILAKEVQTRLPRYALTKFGLYNIVKKVSIWLGVKMTKQTFARGISKAIPVLGGVSSGAISFFAFKPSAKRLKNHLRELPLADNKEENS